jgi:hypothetical protein
MRIAVAMIAATVTTLFRFCGVMGQIFGLSVGANKISMVYTQWLERYGFNNSGTFAIFPAIRRASSRVSSLAPMSALPRSRHCLAHCALDDE